MKFESLKSEKFEQFRQYEIVNPLIIVGGRIVDTHWSASNGTSGADHICYGGDNHTADGIGESYGPSGGAADITWLQINHHFNPNMAQSNFNLGISGSLYSSQDKTPKTVTITELE